MRDGKSDTDVSVEPLEGHTEDRSNTPGVITADQVVFGVPHTATAVNVPAGISVYPPS